MLLSLLNRKTSILDKTISLPFYIDFSQESDGELGIPWSGETWSVSGGVVLNTPTRQSEMITNPGFEGVYVGGVAPNWSKPSGGTATESADVHGGSSAQQFVGAATSDRIQLAGIAGTIGEWYIGQEWAKRTVGTNDDLYLSIYDGSGLLSLGALTDSSYIQRTVTFRALASGNILQFRAINKLNAGGADTVIVDDATLKRITRSSLFAFLPNLTPNVEIQDAPTIVLGTQAGVVINLDNLLDPQNFVLGFIDRIGGRAKLVKCVSGAFTVLVNVSIAYIAGQSVKVKKSGTTYQLFYNNVQIGTDQTVLDESIINNGYHGMFSTYEGNTFSSFRIQ